MSKDSRNPKPNPPRTEQRHIEYKLILPKFDNEGHRIKLDLVRDYAERICKQFGGISVDPKMIGCFQNKQGKMICDENIVLIAIRVGSSPQQAQVDEAFMRTIAEEIRKNLGQESIMTVEDDPDKVEFIGGRGKTTVKKEFRETDYFTQLVD